VIPWLGGPTGFSVRLHKPKWRNAFVANVQKLFVRHPKLAGVQINVEPMPSGDTDFLKLLEELHSVLPPGKVLSVAAYPPPTKLHPYEDVHWNEAYFRAVARRSDQIAVMMYDTGQHQSKLYQYIMANWTKEILAWSEGKSVLLGIPTYDDTGVDYHDPKVENLANALLGIHRGLSRVSLPTNYQGVAIYCGWETRGQDWRYFREHFLKSEGTPK
jgi:spore germination protein YaaH